MERGRAGEIRAGTAAAQRIVITGRGGGIDRVRFTQYGFVAMDVDPDWGLQPTGWRIRIHGDAPFDVRMPFPVPLDGLASFAAISGAVMHPLVAEIDDDTLRADLHELARRLVRLPNRRRR